MIFTVLLLLHLLPLILLSTFPTQDGPAHVYNAMVIREYNAPDREAFRTFFRFTPELVPNWFSHAALAGLMTFVGPLLAERLLIMGYIVLLPLGLRYVIGAVNPANRWLALLAFPFIFNFLTFHGFYNWLYSVAVWLFVIGYWLRHRQQLTLRRLLLLLVMVLLLHFMHIISVAMACVVIACVITGDVAKQFGKQPAAALLRMWVGRGVQSMLPFVPSLVLIAAFMADRQEAVTQRLPMSALLGGLWALEPLQSITTRVGVGLDAVHYVLERHSTWLALLRWTLLALIVHRVAQVALSRRPVVMDCFGLVLIVYLLLYMIVPNEMATGSYVSPRIALYAMLIIPVWAAAGSMQPILRHAATIVVVLITLTLLIANVNRLSALDAAAKEYLSATEVIPAGSTVFSVHRSAFGDRTHGTDANRIGVYLHMNGYLCTATRSVSLKNYEADTGHFPLIYRSAVDPYVHLLVNGDVHSLDEPAPPVDFAGYEAASGQRIDFVTVWHAPANDRNDATMTGFYTQLDAMFELVFISPTRGLLQVYRRRDTARAQP